MRRGWVIAVEDQRGKGIGGTYETITKIKKRTNVICIPQIATGTPLPFFDLVS